jgi:hypothetical protein
MPIATENKNPTSFSKLTGFSGMELAGKLHHLQLSYFPAFTPY